MLSKMLVANDGSPGGQKALEYALDLARRVGIGGVTMICVEEIPRFPASIDEVVEIEANAGGVFHRVLGSAQTLAQSYGVALEARVVVGHPVPKVVEFIEKNGFDLLIIGFMGHTALYNRLIGGTTDRLVEHAPCTVIVVK